MGGKTVWLLQILVPVLTVTHDDSENHFDLNVEAFVEPVEKLINFPNSTGKGIEIPEENAGETRFQQNSCGRTGCKENCRRITQNLGDLLGLFTQANLHFFYSVNT